jgi:Tol biopolymer transport system component
MSAKRRYSMAIVPILAGGALASPAEATFPGSNGRLLFDRPTNQAATNVNLHTVLPDGTGPARLTALPGIEGFEAEWSPDGSKVAFVRARRFGPVPFEIWVMNADGSGRRQLTRHRRFSNGPTWSPDGSKIAYISGGEGPSSLYIMNADGSGKRRLLRATGRRQPADAAYSPDGRTIAVSLLKVDGESARQFDSSIAVVGADGRGLRRLTRRGGSDELNPNWSPDGSQIVYEVNALFDRRQSDIALMNADGSGQRRITRTRVYETNPLWSPDGTRIAFTSDRDNRRLSRERLGRGFELYTMAADGSDVRRLTRNRVQDVFPNWQPLP